MKIYYLSNPRMQKAYLFVPLGNGTYFGPVMLSKTPKGIKVVADFSIGVAVPEDQIPTCPRDAPVLKVAELEERLYFGVDEQSFRSRIETEEFASFVAGVFEQIVEKDELYRTYEKHRRN